MDNSGGSTVIKVNMKLHNFYHVNKIFRHKFGVRNGQDYYEVIKKLAQSFNQTTMPSYIYKVN